MAENLSIFNFKGHKFKLGPVKAVIITMVIIETAVFNIGPYLRRQTDFVFLHFKKSAVAEGKAEADVLVIGDSVALLDFNANAFADITRLKTYNLGLMQTVPMAGFYFLFKEYLKYNKPPRFVIFLLADNYWNRRIDEEFSQYGLFLGFYNFSYAWDIFLKPFPGTKKLSLRLIAANIPSVAHRDVIRYAIRSVFTRRNITREHFLKNEKIRKTLQMNNGWYPLLEQYNSSELLDGNIDKKNRPQEDFEFKPSASNIYYFKRILDYTKEHNITAVYVFNPVTSPGYPNKDIIKFIEGFGNIHIIGKNEPLFRISFEYLGDESGHLNADGAERYTKYLAHKFVEKFNLKIH